MRKNGFSILIKKLVKIYFSNISNKEIEYKKTLFYTLRDMGGVYIKFLQVLCTNQNFMEGWGTPLEYEVFHQTPKEQLTLSKYVKYSNFSYLEQKPFASGSFAQLYKGRLKTGEEVAIKILRPSVRKTLSSDLLKLEGIVKIANYFLPNGMINYKEAYSEFKRSCLLEVDYRREISNMKYFSKIYQDSNHVVIPRVYEEFCSRYVIVQEFIYGPTLADLISQIGKKGDLYSLNYRLTGSDIWKQITIAGGEALRTAIGEDYVFGDPHPGNIILLKENKIAFIDFGIIASKPTSQEAFYLWMKSYYDILSGSMDYGKLIQTTCMCFCPDMTNALKRCSLGHDFFDSVSEAINKRSKMVSTINQEANGIVEEGHLLVAFTKFIDNKNALNIKLDMTNFRLLKAMQAFICSVTAIDNAHGKKQFAQLMLDSMQYALSYCEERGVKSDMKYQTKYSLNESYELLISNLTSLAESDEVLFQSICERMFS